MPNAAVVAVSISTTRMASENYGYMAPVKAALDSALVFLAKSFSRFSRIRFNAVAPGLLKTSSSAGIPGYVESYLYAEQLTLRKQAVATEEVARAAAFLLSPASSGINAQQLIVDAGMSVNYFDRDLISARCAMMRRHADRWCWVWHWQAKSASGGERSRPLLQEQSGRRKAFSCAR